MEKAEVILNFIADIIHYVAWPAAVITIVVLLADPIKAMFARIKQARVKRGDTELTFDMMETIKASAAETPDDALTLENVSPENLNWDIFVRTTVALQSFALLYLNYVPLDETDKDPAFLRRCMHTLERISSLFKRHAPAAELESIDSSLASLRRRLAPILDNPS